MKRYNLVVYLKHNSEYLDYDIVSDKEPNRIINDIRNNTPVHLELGGLVHFERDEIAVIEIRPFAEN